MLKLKRFEEGVWFPWPKASEVRLKIKPLSPKTIGDLQSKARRKIAVEIPNPINGEEKIRIVNDIDPSIFSWEMFKYCLESWEGIKIDSDEKPSKEDILRAIYDYKGGELTEFIFDKAQEIYVKESEALEQELKNSESSQPGSKKGKGQIPSAPNAD